MMNQTQIWQQVNEKVYRYWEYFHRWEYTDWEYLGEGSYNWAYRHDDYVIKFPKPPEEPMDDPVRAVRVYNEINSEENGYPRAALHAGSWVSPYIEGHETSPQQKVEYILKTYLQHGRLMLDAYCTGNLLFSTSTQSVVCVDPGLAVKRGSIASDNYWYSDSDWRKTFKEDMIGRMNTYQKAKKYEMALPIFMIMALDYIDRRIHNQDLQNTPLNNILSLGILLYFYNLSYMKPERQKIDFSFNVINNILNSDSDVYTSINKCFESDNQEELAQICTAYSGAQSLLFLAQSCSEKEINARYTEKCDAANL